MNTSKLTLVSGTQLQAAVLGPPAHILDPIVAAGSLNLLYGRPGVGKSFLALGIARAAATGGSFLGWRAPRPHRVLLIDGDMSAAEMQRRLALFGAAPPSLQILLAARRRGPALDLAQVEAWERLKASWDDPELLVIDSRSSLSGVTGRDPERWSELRGFLKIAQRQGRAILMVDYTNRDGALRGDSRREDGLDLVMALRRPSDWRPPDGPRVEIHFEKARDLHGAALEPILAQMSDGDGGVASWRHGRLTAPMLDRAVALLREGVSAEAAAHALGISAATAYRLQRRARASGLLPGMRLRRRRR